MYNMTPNVFMHMNKWKGTWAMNNAPQKGGKGYKGKGTKSASKGASKGVAKGKGKGKGYAEKDSILICVNGNTMCVDLTAELGDLVYSCGPCSY